MKRDIQLVTIALTVMKNQENFVSKEIGLVTIGRFITRGPFY